MFRCSHSPHPSQLPPHPQYHIFHPHILIPTPFSPSHPHILTLTLTSLQCPCPHNLTSSSSHPHSHTLLTLTSSTPSHPHILTLWLTLTPTSSMPSHPHTFILIVSPSHPPHCHTSPCRTTQGCSPSLPSLSTSVTRTRNQRPNTTCLSCRDLGHPSLC